MVRKINPSEVGNGELTAPIKKDVALYIFWFLNAGANQRDALEILRTYQSPISRSTLTGYPSAISDLYRQHSQKYTVDLDARIKGITDGYKK
jgi:hypothetical protein